MNLPQYRELWRDRSPKERQREIERLKELNNNLESFKIRILECLNSNQK